MPSDHTRATLLRRQREVEDNLRKLGYFETRDPAVLEGVLKELKAQGAAVNVQDRVIYFPWVNGYVQITADGVICSPAAN